MAAARQTLDEAQQAAEAARQALENAQNSREDELLAAQRSIEDAESALAQAEAADFQARSSAALTAQNNQAQADALQLEMEKPKRASRCSQPVFSPAGLSVRSGTRSC